MDQDIHNLDDNQSMAAFDPCVNDKIAAGGSSVPAPFW